MSLFGYFYFMNEKGSGHEPYLLGNWSAIVKQGTSSGFGKPSFFVLSFRMAGAQVFAAMAVQFRWDPRVSTHFTGAAGDQFNWVEINDFIFAAANEDEVKILVDAVPELTAAEKLTQTSRVRQAWASLREAMKSTTEQRRRGLDEVDLDALLSERELGEIGDQFWDRYKVSYPPHLDPADTGVSRLNREIGKRLLTVRDVNKWKTMLHQVHAKRKKQQIGEGIELSLDAAEECDIEYSLAAYLNSLHSLLIGYAKAGIQKRDPFPTDPEKRGSDTTKYVVVPLDIVERYWLRAVHKSGQVHPSKALAWLQSKDLAERSYWVDTLNNSTKTLGEVVKQVFEQREVMWEVAEEYMYARQRAEAPMDRAPRKTREPNPSPRAGSSEGGFKRGVIKTQLKDGVKLCGDFNKGHCKYGADCRNGKHVCGMLIGNLGRVCGKQHSASKHDWSFKPQNSKRRR
jgi:hypothetical protein